MLVFLFVSVLYVLWGDQAVATAEPKLLPLWLNTTYEAVAAGVDLDKLDRLECSHRPHRPFVYLDYRLTDEVAGLEVAERLLGKHAFIAINLDAICPILGSQRTSAAPPTAPPVLPSPPPPREITSAPAPETAVRPDVIVFGHSPNDDQIVQIFAGADGSAAQGPKVETIARPEVLELKPSLLDDSKKSSEEETVAIGIDLSEVSAKGLRKLEQVKARDRDIELENIFRRIEYAAEHGVKPYAPTFLLPLMRKVKYDAKSPPTLIEDQIITIYTGIHVQSISNFELSTMDYDMHIWLRMAWRDARLAHGFDAPILVSDEAFLKKIWLPDPFFANAKEAEYHRMTFLNFYMLIFADGELFVESRISLKPQCMLTLCNYPHDTQDCSLRISSIALTNNVLEFKWFPANRDAIRMSRNMELPELYVHGYSKAVCNGARKTGNFSCLEAKFNMKRHIGFYVAQTYIPTTTCVLFSWISVFLPEEFIEGRIFLALTVFLTLSAENNAVKETLPKVSYIKSIDIWFGFTSIFVFFTLVQATVVITLEHYSKATKNKVVEQADRLSAYEANNLMRKSLEFHRWGRWLDSLFKVLYPVIFTLFLIVYRFVILERDERKCLRGSTTDPRSGYRHTEL